MAVGVVSLAGSGEWDGAVQAQRLPLINITVTADGAARPVMTTHTNVALVLKEAGIELGPLDRVVPGPKDRVRDGARIAVTRVTERVVSETERIAYDTVRTFTKSLRPGLVRQKTDGTPGEKMLSYRVRCENGVETSRTRISAIVAKRPVDRVLEIGSRGTYTSRGAWRTARVMNMSASAYDPGPGSCGKWATGRTACGLRAGYGVVATDPRVIPMGTRLYIENYGYAVAGDKGRAIKGMRIDLGYDTRAEALRFGRRKVTVHVLKP
jgi:3D (Asp-Asp-Asp) domain-containing protein